MEMESGGVVTREYLEPNWRSKSIAELEYEYSPSAWSFIPYDEYAALYLSVGQEQRDALGSSCQRVAYGPGERQHFDWFPGTADNPILIWIHGGYWQACTIDEALAGATKVWERGIGFAAVEYTLAPTATIEEMIQECVVAIRKVKELQSGRRIVLGGHSAGAHLALAASQKESVDHLLLVSGVYDLRPLVSTETNKALGMVAERALALSPLYRSFEVQAPNSAQVLVGSAESLSFHQQSTAAHRYLLDSGIESQIRAAEGCDHFNIILQEYHISALFEWLS